MSWGGVGVDSRPEKGCKKKREGTTVYVCGAARLGA